MSGDSHDPYPPAVADRWETVLDDARATAAEYRADGWDVLLVHSGDVTPLTEDPFGLDVLAPDGEFADLEDVVEAASFTETQVFSAEDGGVRFYVVAVEAPAADQAVVIPAFVPLSAMPPLEERAAAVGAMYTHVRPLSADRRVTISHEDPAPFF